ncbi:MAG: hypothetical protein IPI66_01765 [Chitinophagaceae bacterium]|nr:hypothetical protein [Chitinophagaceae bacterium]
MKKAILFVSVILLSAVSFAQSERYLSAMKNNLAAIDTSFRNPASLVSLSNNFERIANAEKSQWLPYYYAAYCQVHAGYVDADKSRSDAYADKASALIAKADSLAPKNSEISCIKSMIASCHMMVNPMQRYMEYGQEVSSFMDEAMELDPANPRPYLLKGQGLKYTPEQFGGGCSTAKPVLQTSLDKYGAFTPLSELHPNWGKGRVEQLLQECK